MEEDDNITIEEVEFDEELYNKTLQFNNFKTEYEAGEDNANN